MKKAWMLLGLAAIAGAVTLLAAGGLSENMVFFLTPAELEAKAADVAGTGSSLRLGGQVKPGSIEWNPETRRLAFSLTEGGSEIAVESSGAPPAMFRDGMGVVVEGTYGEDRVFRSTNLMVKHSNEYAPPEHGENVQETYRSLIDGS